MVATGSEHGTKGTEGARKGKILSLTAEARTGTPRHYDRISFLKIRNMELMILIMMTTVVVSCFMSE